MPPSQPARARPGALLLAASLALTACAPMERVEEGPSRELLALEADLASCRSGYESLAASQEELTQQVAALRETLTALDASVKGIPACEAPPPPVQEIVAPASAAPAVVDPRVADKLIVGRRERVWIEELQLGVPARIDTGAETSSLDARNITEFERDGNAWVRFEIPGEGDGMITLERNKVREALVLQSNAEEPERRPVIKLGIRLGEVRQLAEFTLSDRGHLDFPMLIGRNVLRDVMLVDVSGTYLVPAPGDAAK